MTIQHSIRRNHAFSLVEVLLVLAIISIMAALVINAFSNTAQDSRNVMARQQQATIQSALNNWISGEIGGFEAPDSGNPSQLYEMTVAYVRNKYNYKAAYWTATPSGARTTMERFALIADYLAEDTYEHFIDNSPSGDTSKARSSAMQKTSQYIQLSLWPAPTAASRNPYPKVDLYP
jgi:prepilin-type N-terminal cleavage/methylation domain-containing protein